MVPFIVMLVILLVCRGLGALGLSVFAPWQVATATALAAMFLFTSVSHFAPMKEDLIKMVPPRLPFPRQMVFVTGMFEILGALGLLLPATRVLPASAWLLYSSLYFRPMCMRLSSIFRYVVRVPLHSGCASQCS